MENMDRGCGMLYRIVYPSWLMFWLGERKRSLVILSCIAVLLLGCVLTIPYTASAFAGLGGYISEQLLGDGTGEMLYLGDGTNGAMVLGSAPIVSTGTASSSSAGNTVTMTMHGTLYTLNGMPEADVWFSWGYTPTAMVYTTPTVTVTSTGERTADIHPNAGAAVYYQFHAGTDGTASGLVQNLPVVGGGHGVSYWMLNILLPVVLALVILVTALMLTRSLILALLSSVIGLAGYYIILAMIGTIT